MFEITMGKGFKITFDNGVTASVQFGFGNYCDNQNKSESIFFTNHLSPKYSGAKSTNAEVAAIKNNEFITKEIINCEDDVIGWMDVNAVMSFLEKCKNF